MSERLQHRERFLEVRLEVASHRVEDVDEERIAERVEDLASLLAVRHEALPAEHGEVLREVRRLDADRLDDRTDGLLSVAETLRDVDARRVCERLEDFGLEAPERVLQILLGGFRSCF